MSLIPKALKYTKEHEWIRITGGEVTIGITDHAQNELTDIIFVELPEVGKIVEKDDVIGAVESVKSVSEVFTPVSGKVKETNIELEKSPELVNKEPYGKGWIATIIMNNPDETKALLSAEEYGQHLGE